MRNNLVLSNVPKSVETDVVSHITEDDRDEVPVAEDVVMDDNHDDNDEQQQQPPFQGEQQFSDSVASESRCQNEVLPPQESSLPRKYPKNIKRLDDFTRCEWQWRALCEFHAAKNGVFTENGKLSAYERISQRFDISVSHLHRLYKRAILDGESLMRRQKVQNPNLHDDLDAKIKEIVHQRSGATTIREIQNVLREDGAPASLSLIHRRLRAKNFVYKPRKVLPTLTKMHRENRLKWCQNRVGKPIADVEHGELLIFIDEKWFYITSAHQRVWVEKSKPNYCHFECNRNFRVKTMYLGALACPNPNQGFNGVIGIYPVTKKFVYQKNTNTHRKGDVKLVPGTMDVQVLIDMLRDSVLPDALKKCGSWAKKITIQMDNAGGHGGGRMTLANKTIPLLNKMVEENVEVWKGLMRGKDVPKIEFLAQPPRSPDLNILDLGAWNSLQAAVYRTVDKFTYVPPASASNAYDRVNDAVMNAWEHWRTGNNPISRIIATLEKVFQCIIDRNGGNDFVMPHKRATATSRSKTVAFQHRFS